MLRTYRRLGSDQRTGRAARPAGGARGGLAALALAAAAIGGPGCPPPPRAPSPAAPARPAAAAAAPDRPRLVVLIVIDQLSTWAFERDRALYRGGIARMLREGGVVRAAEIPYANPFTAAGHATIATGAVPRVHGVLGNSWYHRPAGADPGGERGAEHDPSAPPFAIAPSHGGALIAEDAASGRALRVPGLSESLRAATGGRGRSVAISLKARSAVFLAGQRPDLAIWYEPAAGGMTTSAAYAATAPAWLGALARARPAARFAGATWEPLDPALLARATGLPDAAPGEGARHDLDAAFPHPLAPSDEYGRAVLHTPFADQILLDAAEAARVALALGEDADPDLLAISFSAHDYAGHLWGPASWEVLDLKLRLDAALGKWLDALDASVGRGRWAAVLTSDHGMTPVVEQSRVAGARRVSPDELRAAVEGALVPRLGPGPWVARVVSNQVYLRPPRAAVAPQALAEALAAAGAALRAVPGVAAAGPTAELAGDCGAHAGLARSICQGIVPDRSGELYVVPAAGSLISTFATGSHHDAPFDDNRLVPILVLAPGLRPQASAGTLLQVAPTVAALLGVPPPPRAAAPPLFGLRARD